MLETKLRTKGIDHTVLHVRDVARSRKFYLDVLGMTVNHEDATHAFLLVRRRADGRLVPGLRRHRDQARG